MVIGHQAAFSQCLACSCTSHACFFKGPHLTRSPRRSGCARTAGCHHSVIMQANQSSGGGSADDLSSAFAREMATRSEAQEKALEQGEASTFGGRQLLEALQDRYGRSYDVSLVQRKYLGKVIIAFNIMWKYREQVSFGLSEDEYMERLDGVAAALRAWGKVKYVKEQIKTSKTGPRVGKAISIILDLDDETIKEWFLIS